MPIFASIEVHAANIADNNANTNHISYASLFSCASIKILFFLCNFMIQKHPLRPAFRFNCFLFQVKNKRVRPLHSAISPDLSVPYPLKTGTALPPEMCIRDRSQLLLKRSLIFHLFLTEGSGIIGLGNHSIRSRIEFIVINSVDNTTEAVGSCPVSYTHLSISAARGRI